MSRRKLWASLILNSANVFAVLVWIIYLIVKDPASFRMFTIQSNLLTGIVAGILVVLEILILRGKKEKLPRWSRILKMATTLSVIVTCLVVVFYLSFVAVSLGYSYFILFEEYNLFFHLLTPVMATISFVFFERDNDIPFKYTFLNLTHLIIYMIAYAINVFVHLDANGKATRKYDWYYFVTGDFWLIIPEGLALLILAYGAGVAIWYFNRRNIQNVV
ncbi:MAG: hypothetical protein IJU60_02470 [Acholeplasmatales bacterium]|nr:hypothetical protein [Acholeplasmatales bacterium]